jgi:hypothetical protein
MTMTKPNSDWSVCSLKRAIQAARKLGLEVNGYEIAVDGAIRVRVRDYKIDPDGSVHVLDENAA